MDVSCGEAAGGADSALRPFVWSPLPDVLPAVVFQPVASTLLTLHGSDYKSHLCSASGRAYARLSKLQQCQAGGVYSAARIAFNVERGSWGFVSPYEMVAIKVESKRVVSSWQRRLQSGLDGDNSLLDKSMLLLFSSDAAGHPGARFTPRLIECWHDSSYLYSVTELLAQDLRECMQAATACFGVKAAAGIVSDASSASGLGGGSATSKVARGEGALRKNHSSGSISSTSSSSTASSVGSRRRRDVLITSSASAAEATGRALTVACGCLPEAAVRRFSLQLASAVSLLHQLGWCHRDISPENILIRGSGHDSGDSSSLVGISTTASLVDSGEAVLSDYGTAVRLLLADGTKKARGAGGARAAVGTQACPSFETLISDLPPSLGGFEPYSVSPGGVFCKMPYAEPGYVASKPYYGVSFDIWSLLQTIFAAVVGVELYALPEPDLDFSFNMVARAEAVWDIRDAGAAFLIPPGHASRREIARARKCSTAISPFDNAGIINGGVSPGSGGSTESVSGRSSPAEDSSAVSVDTDHTVSKVSAAVASLIITSAVEPNPLQSSSDTALGDECDDEAILSLAPDVVLHSTSLARFMHTISSRRPARGVAPLSNAFVDLMLRGFRLRPHCRPSSIAALLEHPWFTGLPFRVPRPLVVELPLPCTLHASFLRQGDEGARPSQLRRGCAELSPSPEGVASVASSTTSPGAGSQIVRSNGSSSSSIAPVGSPGIAPRKGFFSLLLSAATRKSVGKA